MQLIYLALLDKLVDYCTTHQRYIKGIDYAQRILRCDPARESTYQQLMRLHCLAGDCTLARLEYQRCVRVLQREFELPPMQPTIDLYEQIRTDRLVVPTMPMQGRIATPFAGTASIDLHQQLAQLQANLTLFQGQVQRELAIIVHLLNLQLRHPNRRADRRSRLYWAWIVSFIATARGAMQSIQPNTHSFVVKVWCEATDASCGTVLRGQITYVPSGGQRYFTDLTKIPGLVAPYLQQPGIKPSWWQRIRRWVVG